MIAFILLTIVLVACLLWFFVVTPEKSSTVTVNNRQLFTERELVEFGEYLLSKERAESLKATDSPVPYEDRAAVVHHADVENFKYNLYKKTLPEV